MVCHSDLYRLIKLRINQYSDFFFTDISTSINPSWFHLPSQPHEPHIPCLTDMIKYGGKSTCLLSVITTANPLLFYILFSIIILGGGGCALSKSKSTPETYLYLVYLFVKNVLLDQNHHI